MFKSEEMSGTAVPKFFRLVQRHSSSFTSTLSAEFMKKPQNEPILEYRLGSKERKALESALEKYSQTTMDIPIVIGDSELQTDQILYQTWPSDHSKKLAKYSYASKELISKAIDSGLAARKSWQEIPLRNRAEIMLKAADLCAGPYRMDLMATTMLGQGKTIIQAEIDATCELVDFLRFNAYFALQLEKFQPINVENVENRMIYRALEGFVAAISPFNFTAIGGNLASCPAMMGNTVMWKPSDTAVLSNYVVYKILREAGVPPDVIQFLPADGPTFGSVVTASPHLAAINFTGSVPTFKHLWKEVGNNLDVYNTFPRLIGECGGKNFHFVHPSADLDTVAPATIRAAFEYSGQKCSACSRLYVPQSIWPKLWERMLEIVGKIKVGRPDEPDVFLSAVIDKRAFERIKGYIEEAKKSSATKIIAGGQVDDSKGYFIHPTIVETTDPHHKIMKEEIFGPVLAVYAYLDGECEETLKSLKDATPYGLTGAVFSQDKHFLEIAERELKDAVGNLYLNDKCTGSVVGQQPFGGARMSGTNDKAGGPNYCLKWASPQTIKQCFLPLHEWRYPYMDS